MFFLFVVSFFRAWILDWISIDFGMDFGISVAGCLIPFPFAHATCKTFKNNCFTMRFACFYTSESHDVWWCSWSCFGIVFLTSFGIEVSSTLLGSNSMVLGDYFCWCVFHCIFNRKWIPKGEPWQGHRTSIRQLFPRLGQAGPNNPPRAFWTHVGYSFSGSI